MARTEVPCRTHEIALQFAIRAAGETGWRYRVWKDMEERPQRGGNIYRPWRVARAGRRKIKSLAISSPRAAASSAES